MSTEDPSARYLPMRNRGESPQDIYSAARMHGQSRADAIAILCSLYRFSETDAARIAVSVDGPQPERLPRVDTYPELVEILKKELGYCACAPDEAVGMLRSFLQAARDRTEATADGEAFSRASRTLEACLSLEAAPGVASWFVYGLQQRDLIWHGFRVTDSWITDKGRWLLEAIERLAPPADAAK